jgi:hypothetical protein
VGRTDQTKTCPVHTSQAYLPLPVTKVHTSIGMWEQATGGHVCSPDSPRTAYIQYSHCRIFLDWVCGATLSPPKASVRASPKSPKVESCRSSAARLHTSRSDTDQYKLPRGQCRSINPASDVRAWQVSRDGTREPRISDVVDT